MEVIRGGQGDFGQEICGEAERGGARTAGGDDLRGKHPAQSLTKACILLKADVSEAGEGWSDSAISAALDTSINNIGRTGRRLVEEGIAAALTRKYNPNSARPRIFERGGGGEIDRPDLLACARGVRALEIAPARGEGRRIEHCREGQRQHDRKDLKKTSSSPTAIGNGSSRRTPTPASSPPWKTGNLPEAARSLSPPRLSG